MIYIQNYPMILIIESDRNKIQITRAKQMITFQYLIFKFK